MSPRILCDGRASLHHGDCLDILRTMPDNSVDSVVTDPPYGLSDHKPTDLMRYLCRLVTPPGGVVLDQFMGSGSTGKAATLEGFGFIGIEREAEYVEIARSRIGAVFPNLDLFV